MTVLAVGSDTRAQGYLYGLADVIRLVRVDFRTPRVTVLEFPRDLWVEIPGIDSHYKITHGKLNQAYLYGNPGMGYYDGPGQGPGLLARTLDLNFGARPDHYVAGNMQTFVRLVDAIGGIDIYLPYNVDARKADQMGRHDLYFKQGAHHLTGEQALMLARIRTVDTFHRADQQNRVLCAVRNTLLDPYNLPKLPEIVDAFDGAVQTDLSPQQISQLACLVPKLEPKNISFITFPRELLKQSRTYDIGVGKDVFIFEADFNTLRLYVNAFNAGVWPGLFASTAPSGTPPPPGEGGFTCP
jgi:LCP family protein required for cell wall assembly